VVLVETTVNDAEFIVIDPWRGNLQGGELILVHGLEPQDGAIAISQLTADPYRPLVPVIAVPQVPRQPVGSLLLLFLRRDAPEGPWKAAGLWEDMKASVVWIAGGKTYDFEQWSSPGPSLLVEEQETVGEMKQRTAEIGGIREKLLRIAKEKYGQEKAEGLEPFLHSEIRPVKRFATQELGNCGPQGLQTIRRMMNDPAFAKDRIQITEVFAKAGGRDVGAELNLLLLKELEFWKGERGSLQEGWWDGDPSVSEPLRAHYAMAYELICLLETTGYTPAAGTAREFADYWRTMPQGTSQHESDQTGNKMVNTCERLAQILDGAGQP
jgi:hypothetical protein